jgi:hypothetical protein
MRSQIQLTPSEYLRSLEKKYKDMTAEELKEYRRLTNRGIYIRTKDKQAAYGKQARANRTDEQKKGAADYQKQWRADNYEKRTAYALEYNKNSRAHKLRGWLNRSLKRKGESKTAWIDHIGCTRDEFKAHIESQFVEGMCWDNWTTNGWHMDHIRPLSKGGSNHYTNLQPLWWYDNLSKSDKV